jgi:hypothetical protein
MLPGKKQDPCIDRFEVGGIPLSRPDSIAAARLPDLLDALLAADEIARDATNAGDPNAAPVHP